MLQNGLYWSDRVFSFQLGSLYKPKWRVASAAHRSAEAGRAGESPHPQGAAAKAKKEPQLRLQGSAQYQTQVKGGAMGGGAGPAVALHTFTGQVTLVTRDWLFVYLHRRAPPPPPPLYLHQTVQTACGPVLRWAPQTQIQ